MVVLYYFHVFFYQLAIIVRKIIDVNIMDVSENMFSIWVWIIFIMLLYKLYRLSTINLIRSIAVVDIDWYLKVTSNLYEDLHMMINVYINVIKIISNVICFFINR